MSYETKESEAAASPADSSAAEQSSSMWEGLLRAASHSSKTADSTLLVLGDVGAGKRSLLAHLQAAAGGSDGAELNKDDITASMLAYTYFDVVHPEEGEGERDDSPAKMNVWLLSNSEQKELLQQALTVESLPQTAVVIVVDLTKPWQVLSSLQRWLAVVTDLFGPAVAALPVGQQDEMRERVKEAVATYRPPAGAAAAGSADEKDGAAAGDGAAADALAGVDELDIASLTLREGMLTMNLGVPIVVVGSKSDVALSAERVDGPCNSDRHMDFLQRCMRRQCMKYGAALLFASARDESNCALLHKYLLHRLYKARFAFLEAPVSKRDMLFIPAGHDSRELIEALHDESSDWAADASAEDVLLPPKEEAVKARRAVVIAVKTPREFLEGLRKGKTEHERKTGEGRSAASKSTLTSTVPAAAGSPARPRRTGAAEGDAGASAAASARSSGAGLTKNAEAFFSKLLTRPPPSKGKRGRTKAERK